MTLPPWWLMWKGSSMTHGWMLTPTWTNLHVKSVMEMQEVVVNQLVQQHIPLLGGTMPAGLLSSFPWCRMLTRYQTLQTERGSVSIAVIFCCHTNDNEWLTLINREDLWVEILCIVFLHHVLVHRQPRRADAEFCGPPEAQLLQWRKKRKRYKSQYVTQAQSYNLNGRTML